MIHILAILAILAIGFGLGRIKNANKLAAVGTEIDKVEVNASADVKALVAKIEAHL